MCSRLAMASSQLASQPIETCFPPITQTTVEFTESNADWNQLATNFINGVTNGMSTQMIEEIGNQFFGTGKDLGDFASDVLDSQIPIFIFVGVGIAISILTVVGAIATCIWACTCRRAGKGIKSPCLNIAGILTAFVSFGFVVAGVTLYSLSIDSFINGVLKAPNQLGVIVSNVNNFTTGAASQVGCAVTNGFTTISDEIIDLFESSPDVSAIIGPDYTAMAKTFSDNKPAVDEILDNLNKALKNQAITGAAKTEVDAAVKSYGALDAALVPGTQGNLPDVLKLLGPQVKTFRTQMEKLIRDNAEPIAAQASNAVKDMIKTVNSVVDNLTKTIDGVVNLVNNVLDFMRQVETGLNSHDEVTGWITAGFKSLITAPSVVALFAAFVTCLAGIFFAFKKKSIPSRGCCSASCTLITLSILVLALTSIVMVPASVLMALGYGTQLVCQPFFYDPNLQALQAVDNLVGSINITAMNGKPVVLKFSEVMASCEAKNTFMQAVKGDQIIDVTVITKAINVDSLTDQLDKAIDAAPVAPLGDTDFDALSAVLGSVQLVPDLTAAQKVDPAEINAIIAQMNALSKILQTPIDECNNAAKSAKDFTDATNIKKQLKSTSNAFINTLFDDMTTTANQFKTDLIVKSAPCTPVYQSYEDVGVLGCEQMAGGIQGMWAAAGLAALFFLPIVVAVFCVASALRGGKMQKLSVQQSPMVDDFRLPPMPSSPVFTVTAPTPIGHAPSEDPWSSSYNVKL